LARFAPQDAVLDDWFYLQCGAEIPKPDIVFAEKRDVSALRYKILTILLMARSRSQAHEGHCFQDVDETMILWRADRLRLLGRRARLVRDPICSNTSAPDPNEHLRRRSWERCSEIRKWLATSAGSKALSPLQLRRELRRGGLSACVWVDRDESE
jgi:hypothetical protein